MYTIYAALLTAMLSLETLACDYDIAKKITCHYATGMNK